MHTELQFSPGFLTLRGDDEIARLDTRLLADAGIACDGNGKFERDGVVIAAPREMPRLLEILSATLSFASGRSFRHA